MRVPYPQFEIVSAPVIFSAREVLEEDCPDYLNPFSDLDFRKAWLCWAPLRANQLRALRAPSERCS